MEIGVFEMHADGLRTVENPSEVFLSQRSEGAGAAVITSLEGSRPILLEVQALGTPSVYGTPRRTTIGIDNQRVAMLSAALESRAGVAVTGMDLYVNVAGGVKISEPAADLGVVLSLASTVADFPLPPDLVTIGEVGLSGEVRAVSQLGLRLQEAQALGFKSALVPKVDMDRWSGPLPEIRTIPVANLREALREVKIVE